MRRIIGARKNIDVAEIGDCAARLEMICDNLFLVRLALRNEECNIVPEVTDNAIAVVEEEIKRLAAKIDNLLYEYEEVQLWTTKQKLLD